MVSWEKCKRGAKVNIVNAQELFNSSHSVLNIILLKRGDHSLAHEKILWGKHGQATKLKKLWLQKTMYLCGLYEINGCKVHKSIS